MSLKPVINCSCLYISLSNLDSHEKFLKILEYVCIMLHLRFHFGSDHLFLTSNFHLHITTNARRKGQIKEIILNFTQMQQNSK